MHELKTIALVLAVLRGLMIYKAANEVQQNLMTDSMLAICCGILYY